MKIAIAGYGTEGRSNYRYFAAQGHDITIVDERDELVDVPEGAQTILGAGAFEQLKGFDMVVRTAGLAPRKIRTDGKIWSATNEFFAEVQTPVIGVTGSKGKGTTASLITSVLRAAGKRVELVGNIGRPALDAIDEARQADVVVYELSSFQLWDAERAPQVAVVLFIEPEHLDVHANLDEYISAKANIARAQTTTDRIVYNERNQFATQIAGLSVGQRLPYPNEWFVHVRGDQFYYGDTPICDVDNLQIPGAHNIENACAAITAVWPWVQDGAIIAEGLRGFNGLPHRLKFVREVQGVSYYDDSIATTPGSAIAALAAFAQPKILILGGSSKGADFTELAHKVATSGVRSVIIIGSEADSIEAKLRAVDYESVQNLGLHTTMAQAVQAAARTAQAGDAVILSPACASFDMFKNYVDRGEQFIAAVNALS